MIVKRPSFGGLTSLPNEGISHKPQASATVAGQGVADPGDDAIPLPLLGGGIVDQDAIDEASGKVATIVPNLSLAKAGHHEKSRGHPFVDDVRWRVLLGEEDGR